MRQHTETGHSQSPGWDEEIATLTPREREILILISKGLTARECGALLGIHGKTVDTHMGHVLEKLDVSRAIEAAVIAAKAGLV